MVKLARELAVNLVADCSLTAARYIRKRVRFKRRLLFVGLCVLAAVALWFGVEVLTHATCMLALEQMLHHFVLAAVWEVESE